ncbi:MAG: hypothetical protein GXO16_04160 [Epsilonproteobacteria bacterium]|nr:hypothetical protein [Campylobacterota bacterium]
MKKVTSLALCTALLVALGAPLHAKSTPKKGFETTKKEQIRKLETRMERIQKRLACVKKAQSSAELKECSKKYPLVKRKRLKKKK